MEIKSDKINSENLNNLENLLHTPDGKERELGQEAAERPDKGLEEQPGESVSTGNGESTVESPVIIAEPAVPTETPTMSSTVAESHPLTEQQELHQKTLNILLKDSGEIKPENEAAEFSNLADIANLVNNDFQEKI